MTEERHPSRNGEQEPEDVKLARRVIKDYAEANAGKRILRPGRTVELDLAEAVVRHYEASERAIDKTMQDLLNAPDEVVQAALRLEGHDPNDVATIAKQAGQIAALRVDIAARSETKPNKIVCPFCNPVNVYADPANTRAEQAARHNTRKRCPNCPYSNGCMVGDCDE